VQPELSRPVTLTHVPPTGRDLAIEATPAECAALAKRLGIEAVNRLHASLHLAPEAGDPRGGAVRATGRLEAEVVQLCVVSLEPLTQQVAAPLSLRLLPPGQAASDTPADEQDEIESENGVVDLGEVVAEELSLALDPYPRLPDAALPDEARDPEANPFAALSAYRNKPQPN
jgi:uncharacterized metal-binding protein YceD (DUF177 family)